jgi:hypothetical protein
MTESKAFHFLEMSKEMGIFIPQNTMMEIIAVHGSASELKMFINDMREKSPSTNVSEIFKGIISLNVLKRVIATRSPDILFHLFENDLDGGYFMIRDYIERDDREIMRMFVHKYYKYSSANIILNDILIYGTEAMLDYYKTLLDNRVFI